MWKEVAVAHRRASVDEGPSNRCRLSAYVSPGPGLVSFLFQR
jgi:hypothetical protein